MYIPPEENSLTYQISIAERPKQIYKWANINPRKRLFAIYLGGLTLISYIWFEVFAGHAEMSLPTANIALLLCCGYNSLLLDLNWWHKLLDRELKGHLYSSNEESKRAAVYRLLFDRRHDLLAELKKAATFEKNEEIAVFMVQVCLMLENFPRDFSLERRIVELLQKEGGAASVVSDMWKYLERHGSSQMLLAALGAMGDAIPPVAQDFIETCLSHPDRRFVQQPVRRQ